MNIVYFLTFGYSLKTWDESSALGREVQYFNFLSKKYGYKFFIVTYGDSEDLDYKELFDKAEIIPIYSYVKESKFKIINLLSSILFPLKLNKLINEKIDITKQNQLLGSWSSYFFKKISKSKYFIRTGYDMYLFTIENNKNILKKYFYKKLTKFSIRFADVYSVSSKSDYEFLKKIFKKNTSNIFLLPNWVNSYEYKDFEKRNDLLISVGRLEYQKNYEYLIYELAKTNFKIKIFGQGSQKTNLLNLASKLETNLEIIDKVNNQSLLEMLSNTKYFVLPSNFEGNPKALLEAMGAGCVVFASKIPNHLEIINHYEDGFLFDIKKNSLRKQFHDIVLDPELTSEQIKNISYNAFSKIQSNFSIEKIADNENELMKRLKNE